MNFFRQSAKAQSVYDDIPVTKARYVVIDTELTGLDEASDSIVSIAAIRMIGRRIMLGEVFYRLVRPEAPLAAGGILVHGITPSDVEGFPTLGEVVAEFEEFLKEDVLVGHFISIDMAFLDKKIRAKRGRGLPNPRIDTLALHRWLLNNEPSYRCRKLRPQETGLYPIASCLDVPVKGAHNAETDAFMTAQVFQKMLPLLERAGIDTLGRLLRVGNPEVFSDTGLSFGLSNL